MTQQKISKLGFSREENIELSISKLAYRRGHWTWRLWLNHWKNICFYSFTLYLSLPFYFLLWPLKFEFGHQIFVVGGALATKIKIPLLGLLKKICVGDLIWPYLISCLVNLVFFFSKTFIKLFGFPIFWLSWSDEDNIPWTCFAN
jgi:hypothetical protein